MRFMITQNEPHAKLGFISNLRFAPTLKMALNGNVPGGGNASPPVFEQIFRNARFAQGGNAFFEGKVNGSPTPQVIWTRKGLQMKGRRLSSFDVWEKRIVRRYAV